MKGSGESNMMFSSKTKTGHSETDIGQTNDSEDQLDCLLPPSDDEDSSDDTFDTSLMKIAGNESQPINAHHTRPKRFTLNIDKSKLLGPCTSE